MPLEDICDFQELFEHTSRLIETYSTEVLYVCSCSYYRKHANCHHATILSILIGPRFTLPAFLDERKIPKHARKDAKSRMFAERERVKETERRKKLVYTLLTSSEISPATVLHSFFRFPALSLPPPSFSRRIRSAVLARQTLGVALCRAIGAPQSPGSFGNDTK
jgi:hypothetical protein